MNFSKRNPLLRNNTQEFNEVIGSLGQEIAEQDLGDIDGGSTPLCGAIVATASSWGCVGTVTAVSAAATAASAWVNGKVTAKYKCGGVLTATAECFSC
ncbi:hypothetical protein psyc5s11_03240 [Clostridium gelidum]|uniref:Plantaricin C family lantibiotic n=1 Tax=Clostridium gelidum TaxID=704125 RepID=A0ABM7T093_9CLOT|nr:plantaricin C family lantibiotic [Clostridium gelidum]BCZ44257.1 hypothetical protein psyc5s11_03240 [Clostridium gelidum]